jgi:hypothetical protein
MMIDNRLKFLFLVIFLVLLSLACNLSAATQLPNAVNPSGQDSNTNSSADQPVDANNPADQPANAGNPADQQAKPAGFTEADCNVSGVTFNNTNVGDYVDEIYDGPSLVCSYSATGTHGLSESAYFRIVAYKADKLDGFYQDQSTEWNAQPDLPPEAQDTITMLRDDSDGYIFMITKYANVQECTMGDGYGAEKINGKYLIQLQFSSCDGDAGAYMTTLENLQAAALDAILRVEESSQP